jgi:hypothetical protein
MAENHPFTIRVSPHPQHAGFYHWSIFEKAKLRDVSLLSYATTREAEIAANKSMEKLVATWRIIH